MHVITFCFRAMGITLSTCHVPCMVVCIRRDSQVSYRCMFHKDGCMFRKDIHNAPPPPPPPMDKILNPHSPGIYLYGGFRRKSHALRANQNPEDVCVYFYYSDFMINGQVGVNQNIPDPSLFIFLDQPLFQERRKCH